jgi:hypothetical protein
MNLVKEMNLVKKINLTCSEVNGLAKIIHLNVTLSNSLYLKQLSLTNVKPSIIMGLDVSGSMVGALAFAKDAIITLVNSTFESHNLYLVAYGGYKSIFTPIDDSYNVTYTTDEEFLIHDFSNLKKDEIISRVKLISLESSTSFKIAYDKISHIVNEIIPEKSQTSIIFFTDGEDTSTVHNFPNGVKDSFDQLVSVLNSKASNPVIHCMGFTKDHDAVELGKIASVFTNGTFQYIKTKDAISEAINNIIPSLSISKLSCTISFPNTESLVIQLSDKTELLNNDDLTKEFMFSGSTFVSNEFNWDQQTFVKFNLGKTTIDIPSKCNMVNINLENQIIKVIELISREIKDNVKFLSESHDNNEESIKILGERFYDLDKSLDFYMDKLKELSIKITKKTAKTKIMTAKKNVTEFMRLLRNNHLNNMAKNNDNDKIGSLLNSVYKTDIKARNQRKLDKRAINNTELFEKSYVKLGVLARQITDDVEQSLRLEHKDLLKKIGSCFYSTNDPIELMKDGECLGLCIRMSRTEAAISDPSFIQIKEIGTSYMGSDSFYEAYNQKLNDARDMIKDDPNYDPTTVHGGFGYLSGMVLQGTSREEINAIIPLFLFKEHGKFAMIWMKLLFGLMTTLDPFGYTYEQVLTIPFLAYSKAARDYTETPSEHNEFIATLLFCTCQNIYTNSNNLPTRIQEQFVNYMNLPAGCTKDQVPNNELFITHLIFAQVNNDLPKLDVETATIFSKKISIEEAIRSLRNANDVEIPSSMMFKLLGVDRAKWIDSHVRAYDKQKNASYKNNSQSENTYREVIFNKLGINVKNSTSKSLQLLQPVSVELQESLPFDDLSEWVPNLELQDDLRDNINLRILKDYAKYGLPKLILLKHLFNTYAYHENISADLTEMGVNTDEKILALAIQTFLHSKNSKRRLALENGTFCDVFDQDESIEYLQKLFSEYVGNEKTKLMSYVDQRYTINADNEKAELFGKTTDIIAAAGILYGTYIGANIRPFIKVLQENTCPMAKEKITFIINGLFDGVKLYLDGYYKFNVTGWKPSRQNCFKLWNNNKNVMNLQQWKKLFDGASADHSVNTWIIIDNKLKKRLDRLEGLDLC